MADLPWLATRLYNRPLLVTPYYAQTVQTVLAERMGVNPLLDAAPEAPPQRRPYSLAFKDGVLTVPIIGGLYHRGDSIDAMSGAQSYTNLQNTLVRAIDEGYVVNEKAQQVRGILLDIDSPGGQADGCFEFCDMLAELGARVPIWAIANTCACSAAYAIAASAAKVYASPSAEVGSIGVVMMHTDLSKAMEKRGVAVTFIHAGAWKVAGNAYEPLPPEVQAEFQASIDAFYARFVDQVAKRRSMTAEAIRATEARVFGADDARRLGLVDEVAPYEQARAALVEAVAPRPTFKIKSVNGVPITWQS